MNYTTLNQYKEEAMFCASRGEDAGRAGIIKIMPINTSTKDWFDFFVLIYMLYRDYVK